MIQILVRKWRGYGLRGVLESTRGRVLPRRSRLAFQAQEAVRDQHGLEIGGPSETFGDRGVLPVYSYLARLDNVNFAARTAWEDGLADGGAFRYHERQPPGVQWIREASDLGPLPDAPFGFILSSHTLEHVANPLKTLAEWRGMMSQGGYLLLIVPHRDGTFDHRREITPLSHLLSDYDSQIDETDLTHLNEILSAHDLARDPLAGSWTSFQERAKRNPENRCLHHHVFSTASLMETVSLAGFDVLCGQAVLPYHIVVLARKSNLETGIRREPVVQPAVLDAALKGSPFPTDHV